MSEPVLAIEWSSTRLSVAWRHGANREEAVLELKRFQTEHAIPFLETFLLGKEPPKEIRIGRGPGNYSGIRQSLAWAFGYCAPGGIDLKVCSSGIAQAHRIAQSLDGPFAILGDARRGVWWGTVFPDTGGEWVLQTPGEWADEIGDLPVYSQEAPRLQTASFDVCDDAPTALDLLNLPASALSEEYLPLYLHPAV